MFSFPAPPRYQDSYNFKDDPEKPPQNLVDNITNQVIDNIIPAGDPEYTPKYVTYGWNMAVPPAHAASAMAPFMAAPYPTVAPPPYPVGGAQLPYPQ